MYEEKKKNPLLLILVVLVVIAVAVAGFLIFKPNNKSSDSDNEARNTPTPTPSPTQIITSTPEDDNDPTPSPTVSNTPPATSATPVITVTATPTSTAPRKVNVYYSQGEKPDAPNDQDSMKTPGYSVYRIFTTSRGDIENYIMEQTIAGPSEADKTNYYWFNPINLQGDSNCDGKNFLVTNNQTSNQITVQFCKAVLTGGVGDDARVITVVRNGMNQLLSIDSSLPTGKVIILDREGNCFGDMSGRNTCKN